MKTIKELAKEQIPKFVYDRFLIACQNDVYGDESSKETIDENDWLAGAFLWDGTKEGYDYWENINKKYVNK